MAKLATAQRRRLVTRHAAENLFWLGRYTERTENTLRLVHLSLKILASENQHMPCLLDFITRMATRHGLVRAGVPAATQALPVFERSLIAGLWDKEWATSVGFNLRAVGLAAASVRERLSPKPWRWLQQAQARFFQPEPDAALAAARDRPDHWPDTADVQRLLTDTRQMLAGLTRAQTGQMHRDDGWRLLTIGRQIERLEFLSGALLVAMQTDLLARQAGYDAMLDLFDRKFDRSFGWPAQPPHCRTPQALVGLLVTDPVHPHSLGQVVHTLGSGLRGMAALTEGASVTWADGLPALLEQTPESLWPLTGNPPDPGSPLPLLGALAHCQTAAREVSDRLCRLFFSPGDEARHSVGASSS